VAEHILALAFGTERPDSVTLRIPDQATTSTTGRTPPVSGSGLAG
jgi:hypothetical protein